MRLCINKGGNHSITRIMKYKNALMKATEQKHENKKRQNSLCPLILSSYWKSRLTKWCLSMMLALFTLSKPSTDKKMILNTANTIRHLQFTWLHSRIDLSTVACTVKVENTIFPSWIITNAHVLWLLMEIYTPDRVRLLKGYRQGGDIMLLRCVGSVLVRIDEKATCYCRKGFWLVCKELALYDGTFPFKDQQCKSLKYFLCELLVFASLWFPFLASNEVLNEYHPP